ASASFHTTCAPKSSLQSTVTCLGGGSGRVAEADEAAGAESEVAARAWAQLAAAARKEGDYPTESPRSRRSGSLSASANGEVTSSSRWSVGKVHAASERAAPAW
ncbi:unnamed protein product, partial [Urochloa humidicola]